MTAQEEIQLDGGRLTGGVVRIGDTVRRPRTSSSPFVAALLEHLREARFAGAPQYLGVDRHGRDVFCFIPGETHARWRDWEDAQVEAAARLVRRLHDATTGCAIAAGGEVVCHVDPGPNNFVFRGGRPVALIDFDFAAPGDRLADLSYMAWAWCLSSKTSRQPLHAQARQLRVLCDAYGLEATDRAALVDRVAERQRRNADWWREQKTSGDLRSDACDKADEVIAWSERERAYTLEHRAVLLSALR